MEFHRYLIPLHNYYYFRSGKGQFPFPVSCQRRAVSAVASLDSATPKTWVSTLEFHRYLISLHNYYYFRSGKDQFPFPVSCQCRTVSAVASLDSTTPKTWVSTLKFHRYPIPVRSYNYIRFVEVYFHFRLVITIGQYRGHVHRDRGPK